MAYHSVLVIVGLLTCSEAYAPILWMKFPSRGLVIAPRDLSGRFRGLSPPQKLTIRDPHGSMSPSMIPRFVVTHDKTIAWDGKGWCMEAVGHKTGDAVHLNRCTGRSEQKWDWIPVGNRRNMIRLEDTDQCLSASEEGGMVELRNCDNTVSESWMIDGLAPLPTRRNSSGIALTSFMWHLTFSALAVVGIGILSFNAWFWKRHAPEGGARCSIDSDSGVSLSAPLAVHEGGIIHRDHNRSGANSMMVPLRHGNIVMHAVDATPELKLYNSLTQQTEAFVPIDPQLVKWYICGPTVYDTAHVGHARNYVAFDIVRRVLSDYFGFQIMYVMNITDIDDKIILRTHLNHLKSMVEKTAEMMALETARDDADAVLALPKPGLPELLRAQRSLADAAVAAGIENVTVCDVQAAFLELTTAYEVDFFADMEALGVRPPDAITRVSDYVPEIIAYIQRIMANGFSYEAGGSVYFDTAAFSADPSKVYGKLDPSRVAAGQAQGNDWTEGKTAAQLLAEAEGELSVGTDTEKKQPADFVLWKASKDGEPAWDSPWGRGRPGWHIECSTMASDLLGDKVDINAGGIDLKFPHHENQILQAEAHFDCCAGASWVNYFLHSGHLSIDGLKMSKSLKNFITIKEALSAYSPSQVRFLFLLRRFSDPMEYSENSMQTAADLERRFMTFGTSLATRLKEYATATAPGTRPDDVGTDKLTPPSPDCVPSHKWQEEERTLQEAFVARRKAVHEALCDCVDTPTAIQALEQLVRATNIYMTEVPDVSRGGTLLSSIFQYVNHIMSAFGIAMAGSGTTGATSAMETAGMEEVADALSQFRDKMRQTAIETIKKGDEAGAAELSKQILSMCDSLRDETLPALGIQIEDRPSGVAQVKVADPKVLMADAERKAKAAAVAQEEKRAKAAAKAAEAAKEAQRAQVPPQEMFDPKHDELFDRDLSYGALDEEGLPIEDASGEPLSKSSRKKLRKQLDKHAKLHAANAA